MGLCRVLDRHGCGVGSCPRHDLRCMLAAVL